MVLFVFLQGKVHLKVGGCVLSIVYEHLFTAAVRRPIKKNRKKKKQLNIINVKLCTLLNCAHWAFK